jgi:hypothetical protein
VTEVRLSAAGLRSACRRLQAMLLQHKADEAKAEARTLDAEIAEWTCTISLLL